MMWSPTPRDHYQQLVSDGSIESDHHQVTVVDVLDDLHHQLSHYLPPTPSVFGKVCSVVCVCVCACVCVQWWI